MKIKFTSLLLFAMMLMILNTDAKQKKKQPVDGSPFKTQKTMMVFIELREGMVPAQGIEKMAKDFGLMMSTGGLHVSVVGVDKNNMIAIAQSIRDLIEIRKFACGLEEVLFVQYEDNKFPGNYITEAERIKNNLPAATRSHDEL